MAKLYMTMAWPEWVDMARAQDPQTASKIQAVLDGQKDTTCLPVDVAVKLASSLDDKTRQKMLKKDTRAKMQTALGATGQVKPKKQSNKLLGKTVDENLAALKKRKRYNNYHLVEWLDGLDGEDYHKALEDISKFMDTTLVRYVLTRWTKTGDGMPMLKLSRLLNQNSLYTQQTKLIEETACQWNSTQGFKDFDQRTRGDLAATIAGRHTNITGVPGSVLVEAVKALTATNANRGATWLSIGYMAGSPLVYGKEAETITRYVSKLGEREIVQFTLGVDNAGAHGNQPTSDLVKAIAVNLVNNPDCQRNTNAAYRTSRVLPEGLIKFLDSDTMSPEEVLQAAIGDTTIKSGEVWLAMRYSSCLMAVLSVAPGLNRESMERLLATFNGAGKTLFLERIQAAANRMTAEKATSEAMMAVWREIVKVRGLQETYNVGCNPAKAALNGAIGELLWDEVDLITDTWEEKQETLTCASGLLESWEGTLPELAQAAKRIAAVK